jgi:hypothetical protein
MVSNKVLAILIVVTVLFSISAQFISISRLGKLRQLPPQEPTGYASTQVGLVNLSIQSNADISLPVTQIDFGSGVVNYSSTSCRYANLSNNGTTGSNLENCWVNQSWGSTSTGIAPIPNESDKWVVQNDGNINITLSMASTQANWTNFIGNCTVSAEQNWYMYSTYPNGSETSPTDVCQGISGAWTNWSTGSKTVCSNMDYLDTKDAIGIAMNITICQSNSPKGYKNDNVTFTAAAA